MKNCEHCSTPFTPTKHQTFCSSVCRQKAYRLRLEAGACQVCGDRLKSDRGVTCGSKCRQKAYRDRANPKVKSVYVAVCELHGYSKIGVSIHPTKRVKQLSGDYKMPWRLFSSTQHHDAFAIESAVISAAQETLERPSLKSGSGNNATEVFICDPSELQGLLDASLFSHSGPIAPQDVADTEVEAMSNDCQGCGTRLSVINSSRKWCTDACRARAYRLRKADPWECKGCGMSMTASNRTNKAWCSETCRKRAARERRAAWTTCGELAKRLGVSERSVYRKKDKGEVETKVEAGRLLWRVAERRAEPCIEEQGDKACRHCDKPVGRASKRAKYCSETCKRAAFVARRREPSPSGDALPSSNVTIDVLRELLDYERMRYEVIRVEAREERQSHAEHVERMQETISQLRQDILMARLLGAAHQ